ncbi:hypothetical protein [Saccharothrix longispora]|uniref:hypothetical protein n=1 Tax=Saccharothrix longispora TaxID=33920 RepID=UPI0028FD4265|nr:hypothetical protein [Saccharothrix longispora]MDU0289342.1 hypothetical protein [Saccharothrix longispora]
MTGTPLNTALPDGTSITSSSVSTLAFTPGFRAATRCALFSCPQPWGRLTMGETTAMTLFDRPPGRDGTSSRRGGGNAATAASPRTFTTANLAPGVVWADVLADIAADERARRAHEPLRPSRFSAPAR